MSTELANQLTAIIEGGIMKYIENPQLRSKITQAFQLKRVLKLCEIGIEIGNIKVNVVLDIKNKGQTNHKVKFAKTYVKLFAQIPAPKDEIINQILFVITYNIHWTIWKMPEHKDSVNMRYVYDCYHIIIFYANGLYVSDGYIKGQIEKIFTSRFLEHERIKDQILAQKKLEQKRKLQDRSFLGRKLQFPTLQGEGASFARNLSEKFKPPRLIRKETQKVEIVEEYKELPAQTKYLLQHMQLNVNQVSPSIKQVLQLNKPQLPLTRAKMLAHNIEKSEENRHLSGLLQAAPPDEIKAEIKIQQSIIDHFDLRAPGKEYYQKYEKVDNLFRDMLDLNYVLNNHKESMNSLYTIQEMIKASQIPMPIREDQTPKKPHVSMPEINLDEMISQTAPTLAMEETSKNVEPQSVLKQPVPLYKPKQKEYKQKYEHILQSESTDSKIHSLIHDLNAKNHMLSNHHHRKHK